MNEFSFLKKQLFENKTDINELKKIAYILYAYKKYNDSFLLKDYQIDELIDLLKVYLKLHQQNNKRKMYNIKFKKYHYVEPKYLYLVEPIDDKYLTDLISKIDFNINNDYIVGLKNLLTDKNLVYNTIGLKVIIAKYLLSLKSLKTLKVLKVNNKILNDSFKFLTYKNNKIKFYSKLYFNNEYKFIIMNTLLHDDIKSIILFDSNKYSNKDIKNIIYDYTIKNEDDIKIIDDLKDYQYRYKNKEDSLFNMTKYLYYNISKILNKDYNDFYLDYSKIKVNKNNLNFYLMFFNRYYTNIIQISTILSDIYENINNILNDIEDFKSNDVNKKSIKKQQSEDYFKYKIDLKDYFLNP